MSHFHLLQLNGISIFQQLQIEEALLRADERNWCIINQNSAPAVVLGISGKVEEHVHVEALKEASIPLIRRFSGGGTVVVGQHTIFITWIANSKDVQVNCCPKKILDWTAHLYKNALWGIDFNLRENDYAIGWRKCGGNAQYIRKDRWLHHTSFIWDYDRSHMELLKIPPKMPEYRQKRSHTEFLCCLSEHFPSCNAFSERVLGYSAEQMDFIPVDASTIAHFEHVPHRRSTVILS